MATIVDPVLALRERVFAAARRHPRALGGTVATLLAGFAATAFGIAPLVDAGAPVQQTVVTENVVAHDIATQLETLAQHDLELHRGDLTRAGDTADSLLRRLGVIDPAAAAFLRGDKTARRLFEGRAGKIVRVRAGTGGALDELVARYPAPKPAQALTHFTRLKVMRADGDRFDATVEVAPLAAQVRLASGTIRTSLFAATDEAHMPDSVASQLADVFSTEVDFHRALKKGDTFSVVYEALMADDEPITWAAGAGRVLAAEFVNDGKRLSAIWFQGGDGRGAYFGADGRPKNGLFLASPLEFSRVTSGFAMRMHPILRDWRAHKGIDYAAPTGTPVRSVGDGVVAFAGWRNGYGNVVQLAHSKDRETVYAHLSQIAVKAGQRVAQGDHIGAVGSTGWSTGPHLHFEFKVDGQHRDPTEISREADAMALDAAERARFASRAASLRTDLAAAATIGRTLGE